MHNEKLLVTVGESIGKCVYPVFLGDEKKTFPIGFVVRGEKRGVWIGIREEFAFERKTRRDVIESLKNAHRRKERRCAEG